MVSIRDKTYENFKCICDGVERGLHLLKGRKGNITIRLEFGSFLNKSSLPIADTHDILIRISRIGIQLKSSSIENFMFVIVCAGKAHDNWKSERKVFQQKNKSMFSIRISRSSIYVRICNKKSKRFCYY